MKINIFVATLTIAGFVASHHAEASVVSVDSIYISTIGGQSASNGVALSSYVYLMSGSSLTLQGAGGFITSGSSINASGFFGDGTNLAGVAVLSATQTLTGALIFTSSFTLQSNGRGIILSTSTAVNNISLSSSGVLTFSPTLHNSSSAVIPAASTTVANLGPCVSGSTITIVTSGGKVEIVFVGTLEIENPLATPAAQVGFLQDGEFPGGANPIVDYDNGTGIGTEMTLPFSYLLTAPTVGTHSYCLTIASPRGGSTLTLANDNSVGTLFYAKELK